ncbi:MAG: hypothetical protein OJF51_003040 [Nitrospira sp.]|jgi:hypothetical protein|nr:MAG: hypothetical protein OJF51_003040 [Nitrospira sp.]
MKQQPSFSVLFLCGAIMGFTGCGGTQTITIPPPSCPTITGQPSNFGPEAQQADTMSVAIELRDAYMKERVMTEMDQPFPQTATTQQLAIAEGDPGHIPSGGVKVTQAKLEQRFDNAGHRINLLAIDMMPWLRKDELDQQDPAQNTYRLSQAVVSTRPFTLRLRLIPHVISPQTVADLPERRRLLNCDSSDMDCSGVALQLGFYELYDKGFGENVVCNPGQRNRNYDMIAAQVLQGVLDSVNGKIIPPTTPGGQAKTIPAMAPITIPSKSIVDMISGLLSGPVNLTGVAVGSDQHLKIGLVLDQGNRIPFDPLAGFRHQNADWGVLIEKGFLQTGITSNITSRAAASAPPVTITATTVDLLPGEFHVTASGFATTTGLSCNVPVSLEVSIPANICKNAMNQSVLSLCPGVPKATPTITFCAFWDTIIFGQSTATIRTCPTCPPQSTGTCQNQVVQFSAGPNDVFYATELDTDGVFYLSGRSTFMDTTLPGRAAAPNVCP